MSRSIFYGSSSGRAVVDKITLLCPEGAFDYPIAHGEREFYPRRLDTTGEYPAREFGGPWVVDVPLEIYHHFTGTAGFTVMDVVQDAIQDGVVEMKRLRKVDGSYAGCSWRGQTFEPGHDGIVVVPHPAVGELVESHGFEEVVEEVEAVAMEVGHGQDARADQAEGTEEASGADAPVARGRQIRQR